MKELAARLGPSARLGQFVRFCLVGGSGLVVDMAVLAVLSDPRLLGWPPDVGKALAAETALVNNFIWNELWTFRRTEYVGRGWRGVLRRFAIFNAVCGVGIVWAVLLLHLFHVWLGWNLYVANLLAILLVAVWNFALSARFNWRPAPASSEPLAPKPDRQERPS